MDHWYRKFRHAFRGILYGVHGQTSFAAHAVIASAVCVVAAWMGCDWVHWSLLLLCMALVLSMEMVNSAIEQLARSLCTEHHPGVGRALDIASAAVLVTAIFAAIIGFIVLIQQWMSG
ncbi:MAG: diacylglycerol kinase [Pirellulaceae bacterium]|nr:MAG: diacylglycerol kinase [Pirellulaceae bacterium]